MREDNWQFFSRSLYEGMDDFKLSNQGGLRVFAKEIWILKFLRLPNTSHTCIKARQGCDLDTERAETLAQRDLCFAVLQNLVGDNKMMSGQTSPLIVKSFFHNTDRKCQEKYGTGKFCQHHVQPALARSSRDGVNTGPKRREIEYTDVKPMSHQSQESLRGAGEGGWQRQSCEKQRA